MTHLPYYTTDQIRALSDEALEALKDEVRRTGWTASQARNAKAYGRCEYVLERLIYPEVDRRRKAGRTVTR